MLPQFANEQEFRDNWIRPFLTKLGYVLVKNTHGAGEHGKDFFFGEFDRFGHLKVSAVQAKVGNIGVGTKLDDLLNQVQRCFTVKLRFHQGVHERRVSSVYVMTNGSISDQARQQIHDWCDREPNGENVYFLNGEQLDNQERFASYQDDRERRRILSNLSLEIALNEKKMRAHMQEAAQLPPGSNKKLFIPRYCTLAMEDAIRFSVFKDINQLELCIGVRGALLALNTHLYAKPGEGHGLERISQLAMTLMGAVYYALEELDSRYSLTLQEQVPEQDDTPSS